MSLKRNSKKKKPTQKKRKDWRLSVSKHDPRMVGLCLHWVDHAINTDTGEVSEYKAIHRKSLYSQFCALLANECASVGRKKNPRQWAFELGVRLPNNDTPSIIQYTAFSTFYDAMITSRHLVEQELMENDLDKHTEVTVAFYCECVSLNQVENGLELSRLDMDDWESETLSITVD
jgi:hypothetical protein